MIVGFHDIGMVLYQILYRLFFVTHAGIQISKNNYLKPSCCAARPHFASLVPFCTSLHVIVSCTYGAADLVTATFVQRPNWARKKKKGVLHRLDPILGPKKFICGCHNLFYYSSIPKMPYKSKSKQKSIAHARKVKWFKANITAHSISETELDSDSDSGVTVTA
jgi:hypothetical protein